MTLVERVGGGASAVGSLWTARVGAGAVTTARKVTASTAVPSLRYP